MLWGSGVGFGRGSEALGGYLMQKLGLGGGCVEGSLSPGCFREAEVGSAQVPSQG